MKRILYAVIIASAVIATGCNSNKQTENNGAADKTFSTFETTFLDAYWSEYPAGSINAGYGKYYEKLVIPNSAAFAHSISFSKQWLDSLNSLDFKALDNNNKISFNIIKNQLESDLWYTSVFKPQEWNATSFNIAGECDYIINQPYAPLDERLKILSKHLE